MDEKVFCSLLHHLSVLRNIAAHHSRLWNSNLTISFQMPKKKPENLHRNFNDIRTPRRIYNSLVMLVHLVQIIEPGSSWPRQLAAHIDSLDPSLQSEMEIPDDWKTRPLWRALC